MPRTVHDFLGDGDGPATAGQKEETRGPLLIMARQITANWRVSREGEVIVFQAGNATFRFKYSDALKIGNALSVKGFEAKVQAGKLNERLVIERR